MYIIDHLSKIAASDESINELITLSCLKTGLGALANQVATLEKPLREEKIWAVGFDLDLGLPDGTEQLLPCYFHWFGTSLCNYARLVGFLSGIHSGIFSRNSTEDSANFRLIKEHCSNYVASIQELNHVLQWRNKVFAHFAITDPRKSDNAALLDASTMSPVTLINGRFSVGGSIITTRGAEIEMPTWSVTDVFEKLTERYWPDITLVA
jgi:hypothetical protein